MIKKVNYTKGEYKCLPYQLIEDAINNGYEKSLIYYIWLKAKKRRPAYTKPTVRKLSKEIGVSPATISKHLPILEKNGLIRYENGCLICTGTNRWLKSRNLAVQTLVPVKLARSSKSQQLANIRYCVYHRHFTYQAKAIERKQAILKLSKPDFNPGYAEVKFLLKQKPKMEAKLGRISLERSLRTRLTMSNKRFGVLVGLSKQSGQKIQKQLRDAGFFQSKSVFIQTNLSGLDKSMRNSYDLDSCYQVSDTGWMVRQKANNIILANK